MIIKEDLKERIFSINKFDEKEVKILIISKKYIISKEETRRSYTNNGFILILIF